MFFYICSSTEYPVGGGSERSGHLFLGLIAGRE
jgi:hypothetical protein